MERKLGGGYNSSPVQKGEVVVRKMGAWSPNVHALLRHFETVGFNLAPRFLSRDDDAGTETLQYIPGEAGAYPLREELRSDQALTNVARAIREMHDASATFLSTEPNKWQYRTTMPLEIDCIGHNDLGPYNTVFDGTRVTAFIDWDFAGPSNRIWDLCYAAHRFVPLSAPRSTKAFGWDPIPDQRNRLRLFVEAYDFDFSFDEFLDVLVVRLASISTNIERNVHLGNQRYERQRIEKHAEGYREDMQYILENHKRWASADGEV
ncbi:phosphotransferase [Mangrovactinospora gilvigrisea]|uniref:phosphotransferase n=1 Tax=Mangrovactinospora gilvigrisea TaxID=1428644 RepID=UPI0008FCDE76|nr:phosphotransferase [Mangrovactinospora gilvigrisea]